MHLLNSEFYVTFSIKIPKKNNEFTLNLKTYIIPNVFNNIQTMDIMKAVAPLVTGSNLQ